MSEDPITTEPPLPKRDLEEPWPSMQPEPETERSEPTPEEIAAGGASEPDAVAVSPGVSALALCEFTVGWYVQQRGKRAKLSAARIAELSRLSAEERASLGSLAPMVEPYLARVAGGSPLVGVFLFGLSFVFVLTDRSRRIAEDDARSVEKSRRAEGNGNNGMTAEQEHRSRWGQAADAVPVGAQPKDTGRFPPKHSAPSGQ